MASKMKEQWDEIARDNAFYGVVSLDDFEERDLVDIGQFWSLGSKEVQMIMDDLALGNTREWHMLEIGCGLGRMTHCFSEHFAKVYAVDVSSEMLDQAKAHWEHLHNVEWILGNGENFDSIGDESMDFVFSFQVFQHVPSPQAVLNNVRETARVLKKGGIAFLHFRTFPQGMDMLAIRYRITRAWPAPIVKVMRRVWDLAKGNTTKAAKLNREYECWRGCALEQSVIESTSREYQLQILRRGSYAKGVASRWSTYFVFQKTAGGPGNVRNSKISHGISPNGDK